MVDISKTIAPKSDQLNSDDLIAGSIVITINKVTAQNSSADQPVSIHYDGDRGKPYKPCLSMRRAIVHVWGKDGLTYIGKSMELYLDPNVTFGGAEVGGIRISKMSHIQNSVTMALTATRAQRKPYTVQPLMIDVSPPFDDSRIRSVIVNLKEVATDGGTSILEIAYKAAYKASEFNEERKLLTDELPKLKEMAEKRDAEMKKESQADG